MTPRSPVTVGKLARLAFWLSVALLLGRVLGFVRELVLARLLGVSAESDQAVVLLALPDMFVSVLLAGGLGGALVPALSKLPVAERSRLVKKFVSLVCLLFLPISVWVALFPQVVLELLAPGAQFPSSLLQQVRWMSLATMFSALSGVYAAWLNAENRFFVAGSGGLIFNAIVLVAMGFSVLINPSALLNYLVAGVVLACFVRLLSTVLPLWSSRGSLLPLPFALPDSQLLHQFLYALAAVGFMQTLPFVVRAFASTVEPGTLTAFNYAHKLIELPVGVALTSIGMVILPTLSAQHLAGDRAGFGQLIRSTLIKSALLGMGLWLIALLLLPWAVNLLFAGGAMTSKGLHVTLDLALLIAWTLPLIGMSNVLVSALNAMSRQGLLIVSAALSLLVTAAYLQLFVGHADHAPLGVAMIIFYSGFLVAVFASFVWARRVS